MGVSKEYPLQYFAGSAIAATINYPLWRASAMGQSGFTIRSHNLPRPLAAYAHAFTPPFKGMLGTILGMTWARGIIFYGSDFGKEVLQTSFPTLHPSLHSLLPPLLIGTGVQIVNQPVIRATITLQDPQTPLRTIREAVMHVRTCHGFAALWHGTIPGILKTVPKYCTAVVVKNWMEEVLPNQESDDKGVWLARSMCKSIAAGLAGAVLTNPFDVLRNEMFKTNYPLVKCFGKLRAEMGWRFLVRGMGKNMMAVSIPVACTIFFTDVLIQMTS